MNIVFVAVLVHMVLIVLYTINRVIRTSNIATRYSKLKIRAKRVKLVIIFTCILSILASTDLLLCLQGIKQSLEPVEETTFKQHYPDEIFSNLEFQSELVYSNTTLWEDLTQNYLHFRYYNEWNEDSKTTKFELRTKYLTRIREDSNLPMVSLSDIQKLAKMLYGTSLLPETDMTLSQVDDQTLSIDERISTDPNFYKAEYWIRLRACNDESSFDCIYQTARAADDVVKTLVYNKVATTKELLFYSGAAISLYQLAVKKSDGIDEIKISMIKYRIAELYYYLYKYIKYDGNTLINPDEFSVHLLLSAEAYLFSSYDDFVLAGADIDINKTQPYHDNYMAEVEFYLIKIYDFSDAEIAKSCSIYAWQYIDSPFARNGGIISCRDILIKIEALDYTEEANKL